MIMAMARHDSCQYSQRAAFGAVNVGQTGACQLGKRKRPGSGSSLAVASVVDLGQCHGSLV